MLIERDAKGTAPGQRAPQAGGSVRLLLAASVGTIIEWYDFAIFAFCAALVFGPAFFPEAGPMLGVTAALSTQAAGFVARPVGGWFFGVLGDRIGRKRALVLSLYLMGGATVGMSLLPTHAQIGALAPVLLTLLRMVQGFAVGGESPGALVMVAESLPARHRGLWAGFPMIGGPAGNVLATATLGAVIALAGTEAFAAWAWRVPFIASALLIGVGIWMRRRVEESPAFIQMRARRGGVVKAPLREALATQGGNMARVLLVKAGENALFYLFSTVFVVLATVFLKAPRGDALDAIFAGSLVEVAVILAAGALADRIGRRAVTLAGFVLSIGAGFWMFTLSPGASGGDLTRAAIMTLACHGIIVGGMSAYFTELFPSRVRYTAMSSAYSAATVLGGGLAPIIGTWLLTRFGAPWPVAVYAAMMAVPAIIVMATTPETRGRDLVG